MRSLVLSLALLTGCAHWNVNAFGVSMQATSRYQTVEQEEQLTTEEKWGVILLLAVAIGGGIAIGATATN